MIQAAFPHAAGAASVPLSERSAGRAGALVLALALAMLLSAAAQKAYRLTLPTDGWRPSVVPDNLVFERNMLGLPSPLSAGDELLAVEGQDVTDWNRRGLLGQLERPARWEAGNTVRYTVRRGAETIELDVPLYGWRAALGSDALVGIVEIVPLLAITCFVFWKRPGSRAAQLLFLFGITQGVVAINWFDEMLPGIETAFASPVLLWAAYIWTSELQAVIVPALLLYLALTFPVLSPPARRYPRMVVACILLLVLVLEVLYFAHLATVPTLAWFFLVPVIQPPLCSTMP